MRAKETTANSSATVYLIQGAILTVFLITFFFYWLTVREKQSKKKYEGHNLITNRYTLDKYSVVNNKKNSIT